MTIWVFIYTWVGLCVWKWVVMLWKFKRVGQCREIESNFVDKFYRPKL